MIDRLAIARHLLSRLAAAKRWGREPPPAFDDLADARRELARAAARKRWDQAGTAERQAASAAMLAGRAAKSTAEKRRRIAQAGGRARAAQAGSAGMAAAGRKGGLAKAGKVLD